MPAFLKNKERSQYNRHKIYKTMIQNLCMHFCTCTFHAELSKYVHNVQEYKAESSKEV